MKFKLIGLIAVALIASGGAVLAPSHPFQDEGPYVERLVFVGRGFGIPGDGSLDNLKWIDRVAVGNVRRANETRRAGVFKVTDSGGEHRYKLRNIVGENGTVSADIFDNETVVGRISVSYRPVSGREAWSGELTLGDWSGNVVIQGLRMRVSAEHRLRAIREGRNSGDCTGDDECEFISHMRNVRADIRSRDFIREKCAMAENRNRCRGLIERLGPEDAGAAVEALDEDSLNSLDLDASVEANVRMVPDMQMRNRILSRFGAGTGE